MSKRQKVWKPLNKVKVTRLKPGKTQVLSATSTPGIIEEIYYNEIRNKHELRISWENGKSSFIDHCNTQNVMILI